MNDPIGQAIFDYYVKGEAENIKINTNYTTNEYLSPSYFFRTVAIMPLIEQTALNLSLGKTLDVGAAAGCHTLPLQNKGLNVTALEKSLLSADVMKKRAVENVVCADLYEFHEGNFDTILLLMNGTGIGGTIGGLRKLLLHLKKLLSKKGQILIDSSDIRYLFEEEDGSFWIELTNDKYFGEMRYEVTYQGMTSCFNWLFVDFNTLSDVAKTAGFQCRLIAEGLHHDYLAQLTS